MADAYTEPSENPFKKKASSAPAANDAPLAVDAPVAPLPSGEAPLRTVSLKANITASIGDSASGSSTSSVASSVAASAAPLAETRPSFAGPEAGDREDTALPGGQDGAAEWGGRSGNAGGAPQLPKRGCVRATRQCCSRAHGTIAGSTVCSLSLLGIAAAGSFALFVYSLTQLGSRTVVGQCPGTVGCAVGLASSNCLTIGGGGQSCENVCAWYAEQNAAPVQFTVAGFKWGSGSDAYVYCPFPKINTNWRIPLTLFASILSLIALLAVAKRWRTSVIVCAFLHWAAGGLYFWVMIQDSAAVDRASTACGKRFASLPAAGAYGLAELQCAQAKFVAVCLVDAALSFFTVSDTANNTTRGPFFVLRPSQRMHLRAPRAPLRLCLPLVMSAAAVHGRCPGHQVATRQSC